MVEMLQNFPGLLCPTLADDASTYTALMLKIVETNAFQELRQKI